MTIDTSKYSRFLEQIASEIDIPPSKYKEAVDRYQAVGRHLEKGEYPGCSGEVKIYPQGSFRLGTVIRPIRDGVEASYDIDLVSEMPLRKDKTSPQELKSMVGERLQEDSNYRRMLDSEGRRCWTLEYAEQDGVGFHLDILPAVADGSGLLSTALAITDKDGSTYSWSASDPRGYGVWFDDRNKVAFEFAEVEQKRHIQRRASEIYASIDEVPDQLVRTPLQRAIQIMKRHRDLCFNHRDHVKHAPISIIITTLAAHLYGNEPDVYSALNGIVGQLQAHAPLVEGRAIDRALLERGLIRRNADGTWYLGNPVNPAENFADRWHEDDHARARAFFSWIKALQTDLLKILDEPSPKIIKKRLGHSLGLAVSSNVFDIFIPPSMPRNDPPRIHIARAPQPWRIE